MKNVRKIIIITFLSILGPLLLKAQTNTHHSQIDPNSSYKDQIPVSKEHKFKDSFKNDHPEDLSVNNYKPQQRRRKTRNISHKQNFDAKNKMDNNNSKHPYGL
jgi:hypothetical protein